MGFGSRRKPSRLVRAIVVAMALMIIPLGVEYARQSGVKRQWLEAEKQLLVEKATAQALQAELEERKAYVQTDAFVEEAARSRLRMAREGEVLVVLVGRAPGPALALDPPAPATPTVESWWARLIER
ncbi:MAG: hypothetical protein HPY83_14450 [Anaerolineae bacterium]|nr:hypothetical protein [Anaerolineae bacterium]